MEITRIDFFLLIKLNRIILINNSSNSILVYRLLEGNFKL